MLAGAAIAAADARSWTLVAWSAVAYTVGCGAVMLFNQRRVGLTMDCFDARTRARTSLSLTTAGRAAYDGHVAALQEIVGSREM